MTIKSIAGLKMKTTTRKKARMATMSVIALLLDSMKTVTMRKQLETAKLIMSPTKAAERPNLPSSELRMSMSSSVKREAMTGKETREKLVLVPGG